MLHTCDKTRLLKISKRFARVTATSTYHHHDVRQNVTVLANDVGQMPEGERNMLTDGRLDLFLCGIKSIPFSSVC